MTHFLRRSISLLSRLVVYCIQSEFDLPWTKKPFSSPAPIKHWAKKTPPLLLPSLLQYFLSSAFRYIGLERETGKKGRKKRHVLSTEVQCHLQLVQEKHGCIARERTDIFQGKTIHVHLLRTAPRHERVPACKIMAKAISFPILLGRNASAPPSPIFSTPHL